MKALIDFRLHLVVTAALCITSLALMAWVAPFRIETIGSSYLIFFIHLPSAINGLLFFLIGGVLSAFFVVKRAHKYDVWASSAIAVGLLACTITLATGSIWARAAWGKWWIWNDPRLLSVAIMWFFFAGYFMLRWAVEEPDQRARFAAVFGVIACVNVPIVHFAIKWFGSVSHPMIEDLSAPVVTTVRVGLVAFLLLYLLLFRLLVRAETAGRNLFELKRISYGS